MRKSPVVTNTKKKREPKKPGKGKMLIAFMNKLMPYILAVCFVISLFSIAGIAGAVGRGISGVLYGLFSNFATYFIAIFMLFHSLMWYHDVNRGICRRRVICTLVTIISVSALQHMITVVSGNEAINIYTLKSLYAFGQEGIGGGAIGGIISTLLLSVVGTIGSIAIMCLILFLMMLQMFNVTPASVAKRMMSDRRIKKNEAIAREKERKRISASLKHRKFNVFDDEDDNSFTTSTIESLDIPSIETESKTEELHINRSNVSESRPDTRRPSSLYESKTQSPASEFELTSPYNSQKKADSPIISSRYEPSRSPVKDSHNVEPERKPAYSVKDDFTTSDFKVDGPVMTEEFTVHEMQYQQSARAEKEYEPHRPYEPERPVFEEQKPMYEPERPVFEEQKPMYEPERPVYESRSSEPSHRSYSSPATVYEEHRASTPVYDDYNRDNDYDEYEDTMDDDLDKAIFREENKDATLSDFLSDTAYKQINGHAREDELKVTAKPVRSAPPTPVAPPPPVEKPKRKYVFPPIDLFEKRFQNETSAEEREELEQNARIIVETLCSFNAKTRIVDVQRGPTVTRYELVPEAGVRVRSIANLVDDIALNLAAEGIRIECPIPGKSAVGIEVPNRITSTVFIRSLLEDPKFKEAKSVATCAVGKSISGENVYIDIAKMPHLLVAGATGMGKSVCINSLLVSLLYKASPQDLRLILIDPKRVEFSVFNGLPHLLVPVVCEAKKSIGTLQWAVAEMERRFELLEATGVRDIGEYNDRVDRGIISADKISRIVIVIDELYDLKMQVPEIDEHIIRLTQKARAAGIHVVIGTQRPSVDVITGVIKANIPSRIAFRVPAQVDSRTILDEVGAEKLVSRGDMLLKPVGALKPIRVQGAFISEDERKAVVDFIKEHSSENYDEDVVNQIEANTSKLAKADKNADNDHGGEGGDSDLDEKFYAALEIAVEMKKISSSFLQRKLNLGFQRAARIIDQMEAMGYIGEQNGSKPREVLISKEEFMELRMRNED
ncbi:MAG: DNA translocase FtsK [Clostridia bacterium]|nr:DNA translocase FtsK [Clostridia bacterium]